MAGVILNRGVEIPWPLCRCDYLPVPHDPRWSGHPPVDLVG